MVEGAREAEVYHEVFAEAFLANCNNPIGLDTIKQCLEDVILLDEATVWKIEQIFHDSDTAKVRKVDHITYFIFLQTMTLSRDQFRGTFLLKCSEAGLFDQYL